MDNRIKNYVDVLFSEIPRTKEAIEMKEEILANLNDKFDDYLSQGMSPAQAYSMAVSSMGDIDEMLNSIKPDAGLIDRVEKHRKKQATAAIITVICGVIGLSFLLLMGSVSELFSEVKGVEDIVSTVGLIGFFIFCGIGVAFSLHAFMTEPKDVKDYQEIEKNDPIKRQKTAKQKLFLSIYWSVTTLLYFIISFVFRAWHISWVIWPIAGVLSSIIETIFELRDEV